MTIRLGLHRMSGRADAAFRDYVERVRPQVVKFLDDAPADLVDLVHSYGGLTILRVYWENQDPIEFGEYLKAIERRAAGSAVAAIEVSFNEAMQTGDGLTAKAELDIAGMKMAERIGKLAVIGCFSVGMPALEDWGRYRPALEYAAAHGHLLGLHQYGGGSKGMKFDPPWFSLRHRQVIAWAKAAGVRMPGIVITESGIDVLDQADTKTRGWKTMAAGYDYPADMAWWCTELSLDPLVVGAVDFGFATADPQWSGFDMADRPDVLMRMAALQQRPAPEAPKPPKEEPPVADLNAMLAAEFGALYSDLRASLPRNPGGPAGDFSKRALGSIDILAVHHTVGAKSQDWRTIAQTHITGRGWAGIGYHIGIRMGTVAYLGDISLARACCADQNHRVLCVVMTGNYEVEPVDKADVEALRRVNAVVQRWAMAQLGRPLKVLGHREVPGQATACPGSHLLPLVHELASGKPPAPGPGPVPPPPPPPAPAPTGPNFAKVAWAMEEAIRILEREGRTDSAGFIRSGYLADAIRRRDSR